jgi:tRNA 2-thiocytidine biosynthesis protein TtcA
MASLQGLEYYISKRIGRAIIDYGMINAGDKISVAVSGGKDSLTLLRILNERRRFVPVKYDLMAIHVDQGYPRSYSASLIKYFRKLKVDYHIEKTDALKKTQRKDINCFWCAWNRRKTLFQVADRLGFRKVALGHHLDDIVETVLLNMFFQGEISGMCPKQELFKGKITLIRPMAYVEEETIARFVKQEKIPHDSCTCPNSVVSCRAKMGKIIRGLRKTCPEVKTNIFRSLQRIKKDYLL